MKSRVLIEKLRDIARNDVGRFAHVYLVIPVPVGVLRSGLNCRTLICGSR